MNFLKNLPLMRTTMMENENNPEEHKFYMNFNIEDVYLLYDCVKRRLQTWEGSPARPWGEQEHLWQLRDELYKAVLDYKFSAM